MVDWVVDGCQGCAAPDEHAVDGSWSRWYDDDDPHVLLDEDWRMAEHFDATRR